MLWRLKKNCWFAWSLLSTAHDDVRMSASKLIELTFALMSLSVTLNDSHCQLSCSHFELKKFYHSCHDEYLHKHIKES